MTDPIQSAIQNTKASANNIASAAITSAQSAATSVVTSPVPLEVADNLKKLPLTKDPELLKHQAKAEAQKLVGDLQNKLLQEKEKKVDELKDKVATLASVAATAVSLYVKLPILDPKVLATLAFLKAEQELRELKQNVSRENIRKAKENFTFPMKPPRSFADIPKIPNLPKIPDIPKLPEPPNLSQLPNIINRT